jgi:hypothetical protein
MTIQERLIQLKPLIHFMENEFVFVQILQRRKDNPGLELGVKRIKSYSFYSWDELEKQADRIQELCDLNNARAYIRLNKQNSVDVSLRCISEMTDNIRNGNPDKNKGVWDSVSGKAGKKDYWVLDLDPEHLSYLNLLVEDLEEHYFARFKPGGIPTREWSKEVYKVRENKTKSGVHLVVKPFDTRILDKYNNALGAKQLPTIQIQKDANTILYIGTNK